MLKKLIISGVAVLCLLFITSLTHTQNSYTYSNNSGVTQTQRHHIYRIDRDISLKDAAQNYNLAPINTKTPVAPFIQIQLDPGFTSGDWSVGPEVMTQITGFYDYKTNGEANHFIQVDPSNPDLLHATDYECDSSDPTGASTRRTYYSVSDDGGATWTNLGQVPNNIRSGFPVLELRNEKAVISNHSQASDNILDANLYVDQGIQFGTFTQYAFASHAPWGIWPQIAVYANGNVGLLSRPNVGNSNSQDTVYIATWNGTSLGTRQIFRIDPLPYIGSVGTNASISLAASSTGHVTGAVHPTLEDDTLGNSRVYARTSTDNGATWGPEQVVFSPYMDGSDTVAIAGGCDLVYKPGTNDWFYATSIAHNNLYGNGSLIVIKNGTTTSTVCTVTEVGGTSNFYQGMAFVYTIDNAKMGWSADGNVMYIVYSVVTPDTGASGWNSRDVFYSYSTNDGANWSSPNRLTNTPNIDETYPSMSLWNSGNSQSTYEANITYMKDPGVGPTSFNGNYGSAPESRNWQIYRKISFAASPIGIKGNSDLAHKFSLKQNYPNPFNPTTIISYSIPKNGFVTLKVYNVLGMEVKTLVNENQTAGSKNVLFDGSSLASGIYFYTITAGTYKDTKKMILVK